MYNLVQHHIARFWEELRAENYEAAAEYLAPSLSVSSGETGLSLDGREAQIAYLKYFLAEMRAAGLSGSRHTVTSVTLSDDIRFTAKARVTAAVDGDETPFATKMKYGFVAPGGGGLAIEAMRCGPSALDAKSHLRRCA